MNDLERIREVPALSIWRAEFELLAEIDGIAVRPPSESGLGLDFAPEAGNLSLGIAKTAAGQPVVGLQLSAQHGPLLTSLPTADQIIYSGTWYCLDTVAMRELRERVSELPVMLGVPLSAAQAMDLTWKWSIPTDFAPGEVVQFAATNKVAAQSLVEGQLYPYQAEGIDRLLDLYEAGIGCLLADEMGLGKTLQIIALLAHAVRSGPSLVVCPASTLANWKRELSFFAPHLEVHIHQGPRRFGGISQLRPFDVVLTSYETMAQDVHFLKAIRWEVVAFDEAQYIKNPSADRTISARLLRAKAKVAVTGTPIENSLRDMWSIVDLAVPSYLPRLEDFLESYPDISTAASSLGQKVSPIVIRRRLTDVAESLPERITSIVPIAMGTIQASSYDSILSSGQAALPKITALRICAAGVSRNAQSAKHQFLHELTSEAFSNGKKVLVFASFSSIIDSLAESYRQHTSGLYVGTIDGRTPILDRQAVIDSFSSHDGPGVLILNPRAAGVGLNIQTANYVVHFTPEWNPAVVDQASARAHRRGQLQTVFVYHLYYEKTIEEVMIDRLESKRKLREDGLAPISDSPTNQEVSRILAFSPNGVASAIAAF